MLGLVILVLVLWGPHAEGAYHYENLMDVNIATDFDSLTDDGNNVVDETADAANSIDKGVRYQFSGAVGNTAVYYSFAETDSAAHIAGRFYVKVDGSFNMVGNSPIVSLYDAAGNPHVRFRVKHDENLQWRVWQADHTAAMAWTTVGALTANVWHRVDWYLWSGPTAGASATLRVYFDGTEQSNAIGDLDGMTIQWGAFGEDFDISDAGNLMIDDFVLDQTGVDMRMASPSPDEGLIEPVLSTFNELGGAF